MVCICIAICICRLFRVLIRAVLLSHRITKTVFNAILVNRFCTELFYEFV